MPFKLSCNCNSEPSTKEITRLQEVVEEVVKDYNQALATESRPLTIEGGPSAPHSGHSIEFVIKGTEDEANSVKSALESRGYRMNEVQKST